MSTPASQPPSSEITPESVYLGRREFLKNGALTAGTAAVVGSGLLWVGGPGPGPDAPVEQPPVQGAVASGPGPADAAGQGPVEAPLPAFTRRYDLDEAQTSLQSVTTYNNYYEFGLDKGDPARNAHSLQTRPWTISVEGEVAQQRVIYIATLLHWFTLEQRLHQMR